MGPIELLPHCALTGGEPLKKTDALVTEATIRVGHNRDHRGVRQQTATMAAGGVTSEFHLFPVGTRPNKTEPERRWPTKRPLPVKG